MYSRLAIALTLCSVVGCSTGAEVQSAKPPLPAPQAAVEHRILVLQMLVSGDTHQVTNASVVSSPVALKGGTASPAVMSFKVTDSNSVTLASGTFEDPRIRRGAMPLPGSPEIGHPVEVADTAEYLLRVPYSAGARYLKIAPPAPPASGEARKPSPPEQTIDLAPFLVN